MQHNMLGKADMLQCMTNTVLLQNLMQNRVTEPTMNLTCLPLLCAAITTTAAPSCSAWWHTNWPILSASLVPFKTVTLYSTCQVQINSQLAAYSTWLCMIHCNEYHCLPRLDHKCEWNALVSSYELDPPARHLLNQNTHTLKLHHLIRLSRFTFMTKK